MKLVRYAIPLLVLAAVVVLAPGFADAQSGPQPQVGVNTGAPPVPCPTGQRGTNGECCVDHDCRATWPPAGPTPPDQPPPDQTAYVSPDCGGVPDVQGPDAPVPDYSGPLGTVNSVGPEEADVPNPEGPAADLPKGPTATEGTPDAVDSSPDPATEACGDGSNSSDTTDVGTPYGANAKKIKDPQCTAQVNSSDPQVVFPPAPYHPYAKGDVTFFPCTGSVKRKAAASRDAVVCLQILKGDIPRRTTWETVRKSCKRKHKRTSFGGFDLRATKTCPALMPFRRYRVHLVYTITLGPLVDRKKLNYPLAGVGLYC